MGTSSERIVYRMMMPFCASVGGGFQEIMMDVELRASPVRFSGAAFGTRENNACRVCLIQVRLLLDCMYNK